jgi:peroxiredoxin
MKNKLIIQWAVLSITLLWAALSVQAAETDAIFDELGIVKPRVEKPAPDFLLRTLKGESVQLSQFKGKTILLNFWATWCEACKEEMPSMQRLYESMSSQGVEVIAVSIDRKNKDRVQDFVASHELTFPILLDQSQKVRKDYFILGLPTSYLIGPDFKLKGYASGARAWDHSDMHKILKILNDPS